MVLTAERSLFGEARQKRKSVCACFGSAAQSSLQPLPDQDTCQVTVLWCWHCKPLCILKSCSFGWGIAGSVQEQFQGRAANALARHVDLHFPVQRGIQLEPTAAPITSVS